MSDRFIPGGDAVFDAEREALVRIWRSRVAEAKVRYDDAVVRAAEVMAEGRTIAPPDGGLAFRKAVQVERAAMKEYMRALRACHELLLNVKTSNKTKIE